LFAEKNLPGEMRRKAGGGPFLGVLAKLPAPGKRGGKRSGPPQLCLEKSGAEF